MACLKLFSCVGKNGTVVSILKIYNGSVCYFCFGIEMTQVEQSPIELIINFNSTQKVVTDKKETR